MKTTLITPQKVRTRQVTFDNDHLLLYAIRQSDSRHHQRHYGQQEHPNGQYIVCIGANVDGNAELNMGIVVVMYAGGTQEIRDSGQISVGEVNRESVELAIRNGKQKIDYTTHTRFTHGKALTHPIIGILAFQFLPIGGLIVIIARQCAQLFHFAQDT